MGVRIRRAHECLLPSVPHFVPRSIVPLTYHPQRQLGMLMGWEYVIPCSVSASIMLSSHSYAHKFCPLRFAQYTYGVYLGLNGDLIPDAIMVASTNYGGRLTALPFLIRSELLLSPLLPLFTSYVVSLLGFNVAKHALGVYFGS